ncbi:MAG: hypothetical protein WBW41_12080 [Verrucomicrobiia bacterium]
MKSAFSRISPRLAAKGLFLWLSFGLTLCPSVVTAQTLSTYTNLGTIIWLGSGYSGNTVPFPPQIDATSFVNLGTWGSPSLPYGGFLVEPYPYTTANTLNYTNWGEMLGTVGWEFDYGPLPNGGRGMAANFYNGNYNPNTGAGLIESFSYSVANPLLVFGYTYPVGYLWVSATNVINKGALVADASSEIQLAGTTVNLSRSFVEISPIVAVGSANGIGEFSPDIAIYDEYWAQSTRTNLVSGGVWNGTTATLPPFEPFPVAAPCAEAGSVMLSFSPTLLASTNYVAGYFPLTVTNISPDGKTFSVANVLVATNIIYQAAFVDIADPNMAGAIGFTPSTTPSNSFQTVTVELQTSFGDTLFLVDTLASDTGRGLLTNIVVSPAYLCSGPTFRPTNYTVERIDNIGIGAPGSNGVPTDFFYQTSWSNLDVNADYAAYSCLVDSQASEPAPNPANPGIAVSVTNLPGRVHIYAGSLNLNYTQMRGEGEVVIQANHLVSSQNAGVDCESLSYNLGSTNGNLNVANLASTSVVRFNGTVSESSAVWSNLTAVVVTNYIVGFDTNNVLTNAPAFLTNSVQIGVYALLVDASRLASESPVTVYDLLLHSTNIVISDSMNVIGSFLLDGQSFTLNGSLTFPGTSPVNPVSGAPYVGSPIQNWVYTMAPTLLYFTNNGSLVISNNAHFGDDGPTNYLVFVNNGVITAGAQAINSANLQVKSGVNEATVGNFSATAGTAIFSNALIVAQGDIDISASNVLIDPSILTASGALNFTVTTSLSDGGIGAGNGFSCQNGFNLWTKPNTGDLWGTQITSTAWFMDEVDHYWSGEDRGTNGYGFTNNVALGTLVLSPQQDGALYPPLFFFSGTGAQNGLYVGTLDLSQITSSNELAEVIEIDPSLTIYYAHAYVGFALPAGQSPEGYLDYQFGGHLRWVKNFTALVVAPPGGPPNGKLSVNYPKPGGQLQFTLAGATGQTYIVQASTNMINWVPIFTNIAPIGGQLQFIDSQATNYPSRYYRTVLGP